MDRSVGGAERARKSTGGARILLYVGGAKLRPIQPVGGGGGGGAVRCRPILRAGGGGGGCCPLSADSTSGGERGVLSAVGRFN